VDDGDLPFDRECAIGAGRAHGPREAGAADPVGVRVDAHPVTEGEPGSKRELQAHPGHLGEQSEDAVASQEFRFR